MTSPALSRSYFEASANDTVLTMNVGELLRQTVAKAPDKIALKEPGANGRSWTYQELLNQSEQAAYALLSAFKPGDRVAVWAVNKPEWVFVQMGAALSGIVLVTLNPMCRGDDLFYLLEQSQSRGLIMDNSFRDMDNISVIESLRPNLPKLKTIIAFEDWADFVAQNGKATDLPEVNPNDPVLILYTSGTTGKPKGVVLSHKGVVNNGRFGADRYEIDPGAVWLNPLPMFHVGGSITMTLGCLSNLGTQIVLPGFDPGVMLTAINDDKATLTMAVPTMLLAMFEHELFPQTDFSSLELLVTGSTTIPPEIITETKAKMAVDVEVIFGQTEAGGVMAQSRRSDTEDHICNTVGTPFPSYSMKIVNTETGDIQPIETIGEICVRSECTMLEYFDMPDKTAETLDAEGWVHTGDLGKMRSDGYVQITGRLKDMIISGGENIYPREIEDKLIEHPDIADIAVFGIPDEKWGETVVAAVRLEAGKSLDGDAYKQYLGDKIARHKIPKHWYAVDGFPINASGKIQKFVLRDQYLEQS